MNFGAKLGHFLVYLLWFQVTMTQERNQLLREIRDQRK